MNELLEYFLKKYYTSFPNSFYIELPDPKDSSKKLKIVENLFEDQSTVIRIVNIIYKDLLSLVPSQDFVDLAMKFPAFVFGLLDPTTWDTSIIPEQTYKDIANHIIIQDIVMANPSFIYYQLKFPIIKSITPLVVNDSVNEQGWHDPNYYCARLYCDDRLDYLHSLEEGTELGFHNEVNVMTNHEENICQVNFRLGLFQFLYTTENYPNDFEHLAVFNWIKSCLSFGDIFRLMIEAITEEYYKQNVKEGLIWDMIMTNNDESRKRGIEFRSSRYIINQLIDYCKSDCKDEELVTLMGYL